jgi:hypothetical protein
MLISYAPKRLSSAAFIAFDVKLFGMNLLQDCQDPAARPVRRA